MGAVARHTRPTPTTPAGRASSRLGHLVGRCSRQVPGRRRGSQPARRDRRAATGPVPGRRRSVDRRPVVGSARFRRAAFDGRRRSDDIRATRADHHERARRSAAAVARRPRGRRCARSTVARHARQARRPGPRPDHRRDPGQSAGATGAVAGDEPIGTGGGFSATRSGRPHRSGGGALSEAGNPIARADAATDPAGGSGAARGRGVAVEGGRPAFPRAGCAGSRDRSRTAGDRRRCSISPPAGALGGVSSRVTSRTTSRPRRAGGVGRSRARRRQPRVAQRARGCRAGRIRGGGLGTLRRTRARPRRPRGRCGLSRSSDGADPGPDPPGRARVGRR